MTSAELLNEVATAIRQPVDGIYDYLPEHLTEIKRIETQTYSHRAGHFAEERIMLGGFSEMSLFEPIYKRGKDGRKYLEVGGGDGRFALELMKQGFTVVETDIAPGSVRRAREFAAKAGVADSNLFMAVDAENLPFKDSSFDGLFLVASLHHLPNPEFALKEFYRVVKPGGCVLVLREPASWFFYAFWPLIVGLRTIIRKRNPGEPKSKADDETMGFSRWRLKQFFTKAGFTKVQIKPVDYTKKFYVNVIVVLSRVFRRTINPDPAMLKLLGKLDLVIARVPLLNALAWDWDSSMERPNS